MCVLESPSLNRRASLFFLHSRRSLLLGALAGLAFAVVPLGGGGWFDPPVAYAQSEEELSDPSKTPPEDPQDSAVEPPADDSQDTAAAAEDSEDVQPLEPGEAVVTRFPHTIDGTNAIALAGSTEFAVAADGTVTISGLRYSDWADNATVAVGEDGYQSYWLAEIVAPDGFELLAAPIEFTVTAATSAVGVDLEVVNVPSNAGFTLPLTGGTEPSGNSVAFTYPGVNGSRVGAPPPRRPPAAGAPGCAVAGPWAAGVAGAGCAGAAGGVWFCAMTEATALARPIRIVVLTRLMFRAQALGVMLRHPDEGHAARRPPGARSTPGLPRRDVAF